MHEMLRSGRHAGKENIIHTCTFVGHRGMSEELENYWFKVFHITRNRPKKQVLVTTVDALGQF